MFNRGDEQLEERFKSLKYSLAVNDEGVIDKVQLEVKQLLSIEEIEDLGKTIKIEHQYNKNIHRFMKKYQEIEKGKKFLEGNLMLLSIFVITNIILNNYLLNMFLKIHLITSLIFGLAFYYFINDIKKLKFIVFATK